MARTKGPILLDNNAIGDAVDLGVWNGLLGAYAGQIETVEEVSEEAGTYFRKKAGQAQLMASMAKVAVNEVSTTERVRLSIRLEDIALDDGERDLWAHACGRDDGWILCGPDKASLRAAVRLGLRDRLISLEQLLEDAGLKTKGLRQHQTKKWLDQTLSQIVVEEALK